MCVCVCAADAQKTGVAQEAGRALRNQMSVQEAQMVLGVQQDAKWQEVHKVSLRPVGRGMLRRGCAAPLDWRISHHHATSSRPRPIGNRPFLNTFCSASSIYSR